MKKQLRVWHIPQVPMKAFLVPVDSPAEAIKILEILAMYDQFQFQHNVKGDFSNAQGLCEYDEELVNDENGDFGDWVDWYSEDGEELSEYLESKNIPDCPLNLSKLNNIKF